MCGNRTSTNSHPSGALSQKFQFCIVYVPLTSSDLDSSPVDIESSVEDSFTRDNQEGDDTDDQQETELRKEL